MTGFSCIRVWLSGKNKTFPGKLLLVLNRFLVTILRPCMQKVMLKEEEKIFVDMKLLLLRLDKYVSFYK